MTTSLAFNFCIALLALSAVVSLGYWYKYKDVGYSVGVSCDVLGIRTFNTVVPAREFVGITEDGVIFRRAVYRTRDNEVCVYERIPNTTEARTSD